VAWAFGPCSSRAEETHKNVWAENGTKCPSHAITQLLTKYAMEYSVLFDF